MRQLKVLLCMILMLGMVSWTKPAAAAADRYLVSLVLSDTAVSIEIGNTKTIKSKALYSDGTSEDVTLATNWTIGQEAANIISMSSTGVITAKKEGTAVIQANYGTQQKTLEVNVTKKLNSLTLDSQSVDLRTNQTKQLQLTAHYAEVTPADEVVTNKAIWTSENPKVATVANGLITGREAGTTNITAKYGNQSISIEVSVEHVRRLDTDTPEVNMLVNEKKGITVNATYPDGQIANVAKEAKWTTSNEKVADVINGVITAYGPGQATLKAEYGTKTVEIKVDVDKTSKLEVDRQNVFMKMNKPEQVKLWATYTVAGTVPAGTPVDVTNKAVWTSSDDSIVSVYQGTLTPIKSGTATISAKYNDKTVTLTVDVEVPRRVELNTTDDSIGMKTGGTYSLKLKTYYADGSNEDITDKATWTSSNENIAMVNVTGTGAAAEAVVKAYTTGEATITAAYGGKTISVKVSVDIPRKLKFDLSTSVISLDLAKDQVIRVLAVNEDGTPNVSKNAEWSSSDDKIAEVDYNSALDAAVITANDKGTATITAKYGTRSVSIKVEVAQASKLEANPKVLKMSKDEPKQIILTATDSAGKATEVQELADWSISSGKIADVTKGLVTPLESGKATITAKYGGKSVTIALEVKVVQKIEMSKKLLSMKSGDTAALALNVTFSDGSVVDVSKDAEWKVSNYRVADVDNKGVVTAMSYGKTKVTAKYNNKSVTADIDVDQLKYLKTDVVNLEMAPNSVKTVVATATFTDGTDKDVSVDGLWKSSSIKIADVKDGKIVANGKGKATITVTFGGKSTKIWVVVK